MRTDGTRAAQTLARYRRLILLGKATLPLEQARRIVGPDCAYHLYFRHAAVGASGDDRESRRPPGRRRGGRRPK